MQSMVLHPANIAFWVNSTLFWLFNAFADLDSVTIARSRKHIEKYYNMNSIGKFPTRLKPISISSELTNIEGFISIKEIAERYNVSKNKLYNEFKGE